MNSLEVHFISYYNSGTWGRARSLACARWVGANSWKLRARSSQLLSTFFVRAPVSSCVLLKSTRAFLGEITVSLQSTKNIRRTYIFEMKRCRKGERGRERKRKKDLKREAVVLVTRLHLIEHDENMVAPSVYKFYSILSYKFYNNILAFDYYCLIIHNQFLWSSHFLVIIYKIWRRCLL